MMKTDEPQGKKEVKLHKNFISCKTHHHHFVKESPHVESCKFMTHSVNTFMRHKLHRAFTSRSLFNL